MCRFDMCVKCMNVLKKGLNEKNSNTRLRITII